MSAWMKDSKCRKADISRAEFKVSWYVLTLDYNPNDEYWMYRDDPRPYTYWTDNYRAEISTPHSHVPTVVIQNIKGRDAANDLWKFLKHATYEEVLEKYGN